MACSKLSMPPELLAWYFSGCATGQKKKRIDTLRGDNK
jgi:hypothetical protein